MGGVSILLSQHQVTGFPQRMGPRKIPLSCSLVFGVSFGHPFTWAEDDFCCPPESHSLLQCYPTLIPKGTVGGGVWPRKEDTTPWHLTCTSKSRCLCGPILALWRGRPAVDVTLSSQIHSSTSPIPAPHPPAIWDKIMCSCKSINNQIISKNNSNRMYFKDRLSLVNEWFM